jgi:hypothetical protein
MSQLPISGRGWLGLSAARSVDRRRSPAGGGRFVEGRDESRGGEVGDFAIRVST